MKEVEHPAAEEPNISIRSWWRTEIWLLWDDTVALCLLTDVNRQLFADMLAKPTYQSDNMSGLFIYLTKVWLIHLYSYSLDEIEDVNLVLLLHIVHYVEAASFLPSYLSLSLFLSFSSVSLCLWPLTCAPIKSSAFQTPPDRSVSPCGDSVFLRTLLLLWDDLPSRQIRIFPAREENPVFRPSAASSFACLTSTLRHWLPHLHCTLPVCCK